jgi:hypothetical protein
LVSGLYQSAHELSAAAGFHPPRVAAPAIGRPCSLAGTIFFYYITKEAQRVQAWSKISRLSDSRRAQAKMQDRKSKLHKCIVSLAFIFPV